MSGVCLGYLKAVEGNCCLEASQEGWTVEMEDIVVVVLVGDLKTVEVYLSRREALTSHQAEMVNLGHHHSRFSSEARDRHHVDLDLALAFGNVGSSQAQPHYCHHLCYYCLPHHHLPYLPVSCDHCHPWNQNQALCPQTTCRRQLGLCGR